ncbi:MAG: FAD-dependent oxidoreductase, partial [Hyphomicrobium sp.]|nr:FAD-dependent oxidoreductase [Hyphomicrobium sp.]
MQRSKAESEEAGRALGHGGTINADICIIGAGSGGLSVAASTVLLGMKVVLIEKHLMGGDCLNTGCVPSKALIAAARRAHDMRTAGQFGITSVEPQVDATAVNDHIKSVIAGIARNDSVERFTGMGVEV